MTKKNKGSQFLLCWALCNEYFLQALLHFPNKLNVTTISCGAQGIHGVLWGDSFFWCNVMEKIGLTLKHTVCIYKL